MNFGNIILIDINHGTLQINPYNFTGRCHRTVEPACLPYIVLTLVLIFINRLTLISDAKKW